MRPAAAVPVLALAALLAAFPGAAAPPGAKEAAAPAAGVRAAVQVTAMDLDVVATSGGKPVNDLTRDEFKVSVDGKEFPLDYFTRVETGTLHGPDLATASPDLILETLRSDAGERYVPRQFLVFFDDMHLLPYDRARVIEALRDFVVRLSPADWVSVVSFGGSPKLQIPFTTSKETLLDGLSRLQKTAPYGMTWDTQFRSQVNDIRRMRPYARDGMIRSWSEQVRVREEGTLEEMRRAVAGLAARAGKRVFIYVSRGVELRPGQSLVQAFGSTLLNQFDYSVVPKYEAVIAAANRSGITIDSIDAAGLAAEGDASESSASPFDSFLVNQNRREAMAGLAAETGGLLITDRNTFGGALDRIYREASSYYSVGVTVTNLDPRKASHSVKVTTTRPGVTLRVRRSYGPKSAGEAALDRMEMALVTPNAEGDFPVDLSVGPAKKGGGLGRRLSPFTLRIPIDALTFATQGDVKKAEMEVAMAAAEDDGSRSGISPVRLPVEIPLAKWDAARKAGFVYTGEMKSRKGNLRFVATVRDVGSDRVAIASQAVRVE